MDLKVSSNHFCLSNESDTILILSMNYFISDLPNRSKYIVVKTRLDFTTNCYGTDFTCGCTLCNHVMQRTGYYGKFMMPKYH